MSEEYLCDLRDITFCLFEHLGAERLFALPRFAEFNRGDVEMILSEGLRFAQRVLSPTNRIGDEEKCRWEDGRVLMPQAFHAAYRQQSEAGWMAISTDPAWGGQGLPFAIGAALGEMFIGANCSFSMTIGLSRAAADMILEHGTDEQKRRYVPNLLNGRWGGTMCLTEPHAGTAVGDAKTTAYRRDGKYYIRGQKIFITGGEHDLVENVVHLVLARCEGAPPGTKGLSLFIVPKYRVDEQGALGGSNDVVCAGIEKKLGIHGSPTCQMMFGDNDDCVGELLGQEEEGIQRMFVMMNGARVGVGLQGVALGAWAYLAALEYARERRQGPEMKDIKDPTAPAVPIVRHPDVRRMLATMKAYVEGGRALLLHTAMCLDLADHSADAAERERVLNRAELLTPICKAWCTDTGFEVATLALQTYGGHGYLRDYPVEQILRDVKIASIYEGTNGIQALDLLGRKVGRKGGAMFIALMGDLGAFLEAHASHPELAPAMAALTHAKRKLEEVTMNFGMAQMSGDIGYPLLWATPYLRMFGNVVVGWLLAEQAVVAAAALEELYRGAGATSAEARAALTDEPGDAQFYDNKVKTARFFASHLLSQNDGIAAGIESGDRSGLELHF